MVEGLEIKRSQPSAAPTGGADYSADGVSFASTIDGTRRRLTPESAVAIQEALGADAMQARNTDLTSRAMLAWNGAENIELLDQICEGRGLAISEMPFGWEPRARDFPRRNRLIAGVALGVDRLLMAMLGTSRIGDVLAFDFTRA